MAGHQTLNSIYVVRLLTREPHHRKQLRRRDPQHRARGDQQLRLRVQDGAQVAFLQRVMGLAVGWPVPESLVVCDLDGKVVGGAACARLPTCQRMLSSTAPGATVLAVWCTRTPTPPSPGRRRDIRSRATGPRRSTIATARCPACGGSPRRKSRRPTSSTLTT